jgi:Phage P22-like portal protein
MRQSMDDLNATTGIYPPTLGENPKDQSGKAIALLQKKSEVTNINWIDNLSRSIRHSTRALLDLIRYVYDTPRVQRIINPDGSADHVGIYNSTKPLPEGAPNPKEMLLQKGVKKVFDIGVGTYDVTVSSGPSYQTKRQEAVASQMALVAEYPQIMPIAGDIMVRNFDWPQSQEIADRLKKSLPSQLLDADDEQGAAQQAQAQLAQMSQQHTVLAQALQQANQIIESKQVEARSREKIALIQERTKVIVAQINASKDTDKLEAQKYLAQLDADTDAYLAAHDAAHEAAMAAGQQQHEQQMAAQQPQNGGVQTEGNVQ